MTSAVPETYAKISKISVKTKKNWNVTVYD
jgi:hypothetical protein